MKLISDIMVENNIKQHACSDEMPSNFKVVKAQFLMGVRTKNVKSIEKALALLPDIHKECKGLVKDELEAYTRGGDEVDTTEYNTVQMRMYKLCKEVRDEK